MYFQDIEKSHQRSIHSFIHSFIHLFIHSVVIYNYFKGLGVSSGGQKNYKIKFCSYDHDGYKPRHQLTNFKQLIQNGTSGNVYLINQ